MSSTDIQPLVPVNLIYHVCHNGVCEMSHEIKGDGRRCHVGVKTAEKPGTTLIPNRTVNALSFFSVLSRQLQMGKVPKLQCDSD